MNTTISRNKSAFFRFLLEAQALQFGAFTLKSGRVSPYFFNAARFQTAGQLSRLGGFYAEIVAGAAPKTTVVAGPAYKGIPLCISTAIALSGLVGRDIGYLFNRKEAKTHGDEGLFVGRLPEAGDRLVLVDDVITDGETKREVVALLREAFSAPIDALVIAFDRMEQSDAGRNAVKDFQQATGISVHSIITIADVQALLEQEAAQAADAATAGIPPALRDEIRAYRAEYGVQDA